MNNVVNDVVPSLGSITSKSTCVDIPMIEVSTFLHTPIGSTKPWSSSLRKFMELVSCVHPILIQVLCGNMFN